MIADCDSAVRAARLQGYLRLSCERSVAGPSRLVRKEFRAPIHIGKPYWDGSALLLNVMSPTAGMLAGDQVTMDVEVGPGAALALSNPSSLRIHKMDQAERAHWDQRFRIASEGFLESNPEWLIPQADSAFDQTTRIDVAAGGELFFIEAIAPGRAAHGEFLAFRSFRNRLELRYGGALAGLEQHALEPDRGRASGWSFAAQPSPFYVSIFAVSEALAKAADWLPGIAELHREGLRIGASELARGPCWNVKLIASDPTLARAAIQAVRELFYRAIGRRPPSLRRQ